MSFNRVKTQHSRQRLSRFGALRMALMLIMIVFSSIVTTRIGYAGPRLQEPTPSSPDLEISELDVEILLSVAERLEKKGDVEGALERYAEALGYARTLGNEGQLLFVLSGMGRLQHDSEAYADSTKTLTELLALQDKLGDAYGALQTLYLIGASHAALGQVDDAFDALNTALERAREVDDTPQVVTALLAMADLQNQTAAYDEALATFQEAREIAEEAEDWAALIDILEGTGMLQQDNKAYDASNEAFGELLSLQDDLGDLRGSASTLFQIGVNNVALGDYDAAQTAFDQAVKLSMEINQPERALSTLRSAARAYGKERAYEQALAVNLQARELAESLDDSATVMAVLEDISSIQRKLAAYADSNETLQELLALQEDASDIAGVAKTLSTIGSNYADLGEQAQALASFQDATERLVQTDDVNLTLATLTDIADLYASDADYEEAIRVAQEALRLARAEGSAKQLTDALAQVGSLQRKNAAYADSNVALAELLALQQNADDIPGQVDTLSMMAANHAALRDLDTANVTFDQAIELVMSMDDVKQAVALLHDRAGVYHDLLQFAQEAEQYRTALSIALDADEWLLAAESADKLGRVLYKDLRQTQQSINAYRQAADLYSRAGSSIDEVAALTALATLYGVQVRWDEALATYDEAIQVAENANQIDLVVQTRIEKGDILQRQRRIEEALDAFDAALALAQASDNRRLAGMALLQIADVHAGQRHYEEALASYQQVLDIVAARPDSELEGKARRSMWKIYVRLGQVDAAVDISETENGITDPRNGAGVSGTLDISGLAQHPEFRKWQLDLLIDGNESDATFLAVGEQPVWGKFMTWDTTPYPNGKHELRLRVVDSGGNYVEYFTPIVIRN